MFLRVIAFFLLLGLSGWVGAQEFARSYPIEVTENNELLGDIEINGHRAKILIDTGATTSVLDTKFCKKNGIVTHKVEGRLISVHGEKDTLFKAKLTGDEIAGLGSGWSDFVVIDLPLLSQKHNIIGLIGADYFLAKGATIDLNQKRIFFKRY